jgi:23S rRNA (cytosine1962-C5)-methyltransferase
MQASEWNKLAAVRFKPGAGFGKAGKEDSGTWERLREMPDQWYVQYPGDGFRLRMRLGLTSFKHVGIFPEQAPNWEFIYRKVAEGIPPEGRATRVLNLFAYTGGASLAARAAGADVTHLDSVRQVVSWARENMEATGLQDIRWVVEDAMKFARREAKRGHKYDGIILDPPAYGHGPDGEKWKLDELLFEMLRTVREILAPHGWMVLNLYSNGYSAALGETVVREAFKNQFLEMTSGELAFNDSYGKILPLSIFVRLKR